MCCKESVAANRNMESHEECNLNFYFRHMMSLVVETLEILEVKFSLANTLTLCYYRN